MRSLESQDIAAQEQEVLKRALKVIWYVHDLFDEIQFDDFIEQDIDREDEP